ncbi:MAG: glycosyltransferase [Thermoplasmata archaeon]|nr:glycosyltransferase [Thermoplasmata archaeon]
MAIAEPRPTADLVGGVVAYNEERRLATAVESLLAQRLPEGVRWRAITIVASGCTDRTTEVANALAAAHAEVHVLVQPDRRGKASALREIFRAARGDYLVLLNADAAADPDAVAALLHASISLPRPFAVMGRPWPSELPPARIGAGLQLLWNLHHRLHAELIASGEGTHLSDELLLLPISHLPPLPPGVVNDGAFIGAWLRSQGGSLAYAPDARVHIEVPWTLSDHVRQRRRIHSGHRQVKELVGVTPTTIESFFLRRPKRAVGLLGSAVRETPDGGIALVWLAAGELASAAAAFWDSIPPRRSHRLWVPIREAPSSPGPSGPTGARTSPSRATFDRPG